MATRVNPGLRRRSRGAVAEILRQPLEPHPAPHLARDLLDRRDVAELAPRGGLRLRARLAAVHAIADRHVEVRRGFPRRARRRDRAASAGRHASLRFPPLRIPPIASTSCAHRDRSDASWRRPGGGQPVDARALLVVGDLPRRRDPLAPLEPVQRRVQRAGVDLQHVARVRADGLGDAVAVLRAPLEGLEDEQVERALEQLDAVLVAGALWP